MRAIEGRSKEAVANRGGSFVAVLLLAAACAMGGASGVHAQQACDVEEAQRLFGQQPRQDARVGELLDACVRTGSTDYRVYMFQGVMARDRGDRDKAIEFLRKAHEMAPKEVNPALELAYTLEAGHRTEARQVYEEVLKGDPQSRPALLGLARVARSQNRLDEAQGIYARLLAVNPQDPDALNGMAWLAMAERRREEARTGFEHVLAVEPGNEEAKTGLSKVDDVYRYTFDADGAVVSTSNGTSWGFGGRGLAGISAFDTLEAGWLHYTNELVTLSALGVSVLPSDDIRLGYHRLVPLSYAVSLTYDYRGHHSLPSEHWIDGSAAIYLTDYLRWYGGYRQAFGGYQYDGRLIRTGLAASMTDSLEVGLTVYNAAQAIFNNYREIWSWVFDVTWHGPHNMLLLGGFGYSPTINNLDLHGRAVLPVTDRIAIQLAVGHNSINDDTRATLGLRFTW